MQIVVQYSMNSDSSEPLYPNLSANRAPNGFHYEGTVLVTDSASQSLAEKPLAAHYERRKKATGKGADAAQRGAGRIRDSLS